MKIDRRRFLGALAIGSAGLAAARPADPAAFLSPRPMESPAAGHRRAFASVGSGEPPVLLERAMIGLDTHASMITHRDVVGLVDFSLPSGLPRLQLVDLAGGRVISRHLVAHGRGSDPANTGWVHSFSNQSGSNASSRGCFVTAGTYVGKHGRSRRLLGLDPDNSNASSRAIVIHAAGYVSEEMAGTRGRIGRSQGCFAVTEDEVGDLLGRLGEGRLLLAWK